MPVSYSPWLVLLSVALAIQGSYVGLSFAVQVAGAEGTRRRALLAGAAITLALGVWTMHFVGMLAERVPFPVDYLVLPTLLSFLVCVIVVGAGLLAASAGPPTLPRTPPPPCSWDSASWRCITWAWRRCAPARRWPIRRRSCWPQRRSRSPRPEWRCGSPWAALRDGFRSPRPSSASPSPACITRR